MEKHELLYDIIINEKQVRVRARPPGLVPVARRYTTLQFHVHLLCRLDVCGYVITV